MMNMYADFKPELNTEFKPELSRTSLANLIIANCGVKKTINDIIKSISSLEDKHGIGNVLRLLNIIEVAKMIGTIYDQQDEPIATLKYFATFLKDEENYRYFTTQSHAKFLSRKYAQFYKDKNKELINEVILDNKCMVQITEALYSKHGDDYSKYLYNISLVITKFATDVLEIPALMLDSKKQSLITKHMFCLITL